MQNSCEKLESRIYIYQNEYYHLFILSEMILSKAKKSYTFASSSFQRISPQKKKLKTNKVSVEKRWMTFNQDEETGLDTKNLDAQNFLLANQTFVNKNLPVIEVKCMQTKFFGFLDEFSKQLDSFKKRNFDQKENISQKPKVGSVKSQKSLNSSKKCVKYEKKYCRSRGSFSNHLSSIVSQSIQKNIKIHEKVKVMMKNGGIFEGQTRYGQLIYGKVHFDSGLQYEGFFEDQQFHGQGKLYCPNGSVIYCEWIKGKPRQMGRIEYSNGDIFQGQIKNYKKHGRGIIIFKKNHQKYIGEFYNGEITGLGTLYNRQGQNIAEGIWQDGKLIDGNVVDLYSETQSQSLE